MKFNRFLGQFVNLSFMKFRAALLLIVLISSSSYLFAKDDDKAEAPVEVRLAAASKVLKDTRVRFLLFTSRDWFARLVRSAFAKTFPK